MAHAAALRPKQVPVAPLLRRTSRGQLHAWRDPLVVVPADATPDPLQPAADPSDFAVVDKMVG